MKDDDIFHERLNAFRVRVGALASEDTLGNNGAFDVPAWELGMKSAYKVRFFAVVSDGLGWDHVSISVREKLLRKKYIVRIPTWEEMQVITDFFFKPEEVAMQVMMPMANPKRVNFHECVLHLWRPQTVELPLPPKYMV